MIPNHDYTQVSVRQLKLLKFDVSSRFIPPQTHTENESDLLKNPLVLEMYQTFSGYFKIHDCARALKASKDDIEEAANFLVSEKEKPNQIIFKRTSSQILCESQLMNASEPEKSDWQLMPGSMITQRAACPGRWTLA